MHPIAATVSRGKIATRDLFALIEQDLRAVEARLQEELRSDAPFVDELLRYIAALGGKRLRPALVMLAARATGDIRPAHTVIAAVVEMIHIATLVHDDVLDNADHRRHQRTVHQRWGTPAAVLLGDHLFSHAFYLSATLDDTFACQTIGRSTNIVCEGELRQVGGQGKWQTTEDEYLSVIGAKTAELCACSCLLGAHYAGADAATSRLLEAFGFQLGIAFQIADDVLDVTGDPDFVGKTLGTDLLGEKLTLPTIHFFREATPSVAAQWRASLGAPAGLSPEILGQFLVVLEETGSIAYAQEQARAAAERAHELLERLPASRAKSTLQAVCHFVVNRGH